MSVSQWLYSVFLRNIFVDTYGFWCEACPVPWFAVLMWALLNYVNRYTFSMDTSLLPKGSSLWRELASLRNIFHIWLLCICQGWEQAFIWGGGRQSTQPVSWQMPGVPKRTVVGDNNTESQIPTQLHHFLGNSVLSCHYKAFLSLSSLFPPFDAPYFLFLHEVNSFR